MENVNGRELWVTLLAPGFVLQSQPGDVVSVAAHAASAFSSVRGWFELRDADRNLLFWYGDASNVPALKVPEGPQLTLREGAVQAEVGDPCMPRWAQKKLQVEFAGATAEVGYGDQLQLGGWWISNVGIDVALSEFRCTDGWGGGATAALWPIP